MNLKSFKKYVCLFCLASILAVQTGCVVEDVSGSATGGSEDGGAGGENQSPFDYAGCISGQGTGTKSIEINFSFPPEASSVRINRDGNQIAEFSSANITTSHTDNNGLVEGQTYLYTCEAVIDGLSAEGENTLQLSTLAVNAPLFSGIDTAVEVNSHSVRVTWVPSISDDPVSARTYQVFANVGDAVDFTAPPRVTTNQGDPVPGQADVNGLGDELKYVFAVRACSQGGICDINTIVRSVTTSDGGVPLTLGVTSPLSIDNGVLQITAAWAEAQGGIARRYVYIRNGAVGGTNIGDYILERTFLLSGDDLFSPPQTLMISPLQEGQTYHVIVQDEDPSGNRTVPTTFETIDVIDITAPGFGGITNMARGVPADSVMTLSWTGIDTEVVDPLNGGTLYKVLVLSAPSPIATNPCTFGIEQASLNVSAYTAGATATYDLIGLDEKSYHSVCVKAVDLAGNTSTNNNSLQLNTLDITPPDFIGIQGLSFDNQSQSMNLSWNASTAADIKEYRITLWVNQPTPPGSPTTLVRSHATSSTGTVVSSVDFTLADNDEVYALVEACDTTEPPFGVQNCSVTAVQRSTVVPDVTPPPNFLGIRGPTDILTPAEGEFTVQWNAPADYSDYRGFRVYQVDPVTNDLALLRTCPCVDFGCSDTLTQCTVNGLDAFRTYRLHVRAYDQANNETLYLDPATNFSDKRTTDTTAPAFASNLVVGASPTFILSWNVGIDNQFSTEPGAEINYEVYQNTSPFDFTNPSQPDGNLKTSTTALTFEDNGFIEAQIYYYTICATDASNNTTCDQLTRNFTVPDVTKPQILNLTSTKTVKSKVWELNWEMNDNISTNANLQVEIRSRVSVSGDLATIADPVVYNGLGSTVIVAGDNASTTQAASLDPLSGPPELNRQINYLVTIRDEEGNISSSNITVNSTNIITVSSVSGTTGPVAGGKLVVVYGTGFSSSVDNGVGKDTEVLIGGQLCTGVAILSENAITCTTPSVGVPGSVEVRVRTQVNNPVSAANIVEAEQAITNGYTYSASPIICDNPGSWGPSFAAGTGTSLDPYIICDVSHLTSARGISASGASYRLAENIDLTAVSFDPLGDATTNFVGNFDGDGHVILNWTYNNPQINVGFFGFVSGDFQVSDFGLVNVDIIANQSVGALIGVVEGGVSKTVLISNVFATGTITADDFVGGLIGRKQNDHVNFNMINSYFVGDVVVNGITGYGGGIAGFLGPDLGGLFQSVYSEGSVTGTRLLGGLFGNLGQGKQLQDSFSRATVAATGNSAGGIAGEAKAGSLITNTFSESGTVSGIDNIGGIAGISEGSLTGVYSTEVITSTGRRAGGIAGYANGSTISDVYSTARHSFVNSGGGVVGELSDSTLTEAYATAGLDATGTDIGGLVGRIFVGVSGTGSISKSYSEGTLGTVGSSVGGLVGSINTLNNGVLSISEVFSRSEVGNNFTLPNQRYGGLIGVADTNAGSSINITNCYATGSVSVGQYGGGLLGGFIVAGGSVNISFCYLASPILGGTSDRGGVFGQADPSVMNISDTFYDTEVSFQSFPVTVGSATGTVTGHTTAELQDFSNSVYVGWDFATVWTVPVSGYPQLQFEN